MRCGLGHGGPFSWAGGAVPGREPGHADQGSHAGVGRANRGPRAAARGAGKGKGKGNRYTSPHVGFAASRSASVG
ncbi:hypothetical protein GCM10022206_06500 [Streptomyces chiangmaiensis]